MNSTKKKQKMYPSTFVFIYRFYTTSFFQEQTSFFQEQRCRQMEHFFCSVASLLSSQLRSVIFKTMEDLLNLLEGFSDGNEYEGEYETSNMRYKNLHPPLLISMVSWKKSTKAKITKTEQLTNFLANRAIFGITRFLIRQD